MMRVTNWQSLNPVWKQMQEEMNRLFRRWDGGLRSFAASYPAVNIWEDKDSVFVEAELPGINANELEIHVTGGDQLTLKGERKVELPEGAVSHRQERGAGSFVRVLTLPFRVDADKVEAHYENGVLLIKVAKHEAAKPRKIIVTG
jgi:HSP20 family protein